MKTHLILVKTGEADSLATLGPVSRSGRIFLRMAEPLPEGDNIALKLLGPANTSHLIDGTIVDCIRAPDGQFHLQADFSQSIATLFLQMEGQGAPVKTAMPSAPAKGRVSPASRTAKKTPAKIGKKSPGSALPTPEIVEIEDIDGIEEITDEVEIGEIKALEEINDLDIIEVQPDPAARTEADDPGAFSEPVSHNITEGALGFDDMRQIVSQDDMTIAPAPPDETPAFVPAAVEKKTLTDQERKIAEPVGKFLMNLTKAMCRSGYYDPEHPSAASAKKGLYEEFLQNAGQYNEIMFTREKSRKTLDINITGVTDDQVSVRMLVGQGVAELFLPKLSEYYDRKGLISFAIRKEINLARFDRFIDIMSDPKVDRQETSKAGDLLTSALVENGITEISTVFISDRIELGLDLPWRVEMAIQRLAKDFKVMPMFKNVSSDVLRKLKMQTIADILRPLRHPRFYSDFLVNCHVIAREVKDVPSEEIERMIVDAFPLEQLIPTSHFTFAELGRLEKRKTEEAATSEVGHRLTSIRRILKMVARRVAVDRPKGAVHFLADLFKNSILAFEDLPPEAQYLVNSRRLADDIIADFSKYERSLRDPKTPEDAVVCLKCFRRAAPILIEEKAFDVLLRISGLIREVATGKILQSDAVRLELENVQNKLEMAADTPETVDAIEPSAPFYLFVFGDTPDLLISVFDQADVGEHKTVGVFLESIGLLGVRVLSRVLAESKNRESRKFAVESMIGIGEMSRKWALQVIADKNNAWYLHRNAMMILRHVSRHPEDFERVRIFVTHENQRLREEAVGLIIALRPSDTESLVIKLLDDPEPKMRWRAARALADISPISGNAITEIMGIITGPPSGSRKAVVEHKKKIANLISAINGMSNISNTFRVETDLIWLMESITEQEKGMLKIFKRGTITDEDIGVIKAAVPLLGRIGTAASETALNKMRRTVPHLAEEIDAALIKIRTRDGQ